MKTADEQGHSFEWRAPNVLVTRLRGRLDETGATAHMTESLRAYRAGTVVHHFFDFEQMTGYSSAARSMLTDFAAKNRASVASATFLVKSKLVAMGVQTAALALQLVGLELHLAKDQREFDARLDAACKPRANNTR